MASVVVTGTGLITGLGSSVAACFERVCAGESASRPVERFLREGLERPLAAPVVDREALGDGPFVTELFLHAANEALDAAGLALPLAETPLIVANTIGSPAASERPGGWEHAAPDAPETLKRYAQASLVAQAAERLGARGRVDVVGNTCAAGNYAIGLGASLIRRGLARRVVVGGVEEVSVLSFSAFAALRAIGDPCRPFDAARDGMLFGEGAAVLVLEAEEEARSRGCPVLGEVAAVTYSNDAYHLVAPDPEGKGLERALREGLSRAGLDGVDYINAHGTGTELNDGAEARALRRVLCDGPWVSSTKGATGHCMGAASAVEAVLTLASMERGWLLPNVGVREQDPDAPARLICATRPATVERAASVGLGFGGNNSVLFLRRHPKASRPPTERSVYLRPASAIVGELEGLDAVLAGLRGGKAVEARAAFDAKAILGRKGLRHVDPGALIFAAAMALAAERPEVSPDRMGVCVGGAFPAYASVVGILRAFQRGGPRAVPPMLVPFATVNCASSWWMMREGITGFNGCPVSGDCAGLDAVLWAAEQIQDAVIDAAVAGASEGASEELWRGLELSVVESAAAVWVQSEATGASAQLVGSARAFNATTPASAVESVRARFEADRVYTARAFRGAIDVTWECLSVSGVLALLRALVEIRSGERILVMSDSRDGFATGLLLKGVSREF